MYSILTFLFWTKFYLPGGLYLSFYRFYIYVNFFCMNLLYSIVLQLSTLFSNLFCIFRHLCVFYIFIRFYCVFLFICYIFSTKYNRFIWSIYINIIFLYKKLPWKTNKKMSISPLSMLWYERWKSRSNEEKKGGFPWQ